MDAELHLPRILTANVTTAIVKQRDERYTPNQAIVEATLRPFRPRPPTRSRMTRLPRDVPVDEARFNLESRHHVSEVFHRLSELRRCMLDDLPVECPG